MFTFFRKHYKYIAILLGIVLTVEVLLFSLSAVGGDSRVVANDNHKIAAELSNMTGISTDQILKMKSTGKTWNEIIETLKQDSSLDLQSGKEDRSLLLMNMGLDDQAVERFMAEGYAEQEITEAKLLAERVVFQLRELVQSTESIVNMDREDLERDTFRTVAEQFNMEAAVHFMLRLKVEFGGYESVLNEYLSTLQLGLNLENYLVDKEQYLNDKEIKRMEHIGERMVSLSEIERALLEQIQSQNSANSEAMTNPGSLEQDASVDTEIEIPLPEVPTPSALDVKPKNPAQSILDEIKRINPNDPNTY